MRRDHLLREYVYRVAYGYTRFFKVLTKDQTF